MSDQEIAKTASKVAKIATLDDEIAKLEELFRAFRKQAR
jgi:hypothetical protein